MRTVATYLGGLFVVGSALAALVMVYAAWFPYENVPSDRLREDDWLALAAPAVLGLAVATLTFVVKQKARLAALALAADAAIGLLVLQFALRELSDRSDTELVLSVGGIGLLGLGAVIASFRQEASP